MKTTDAYIVRYTYKKNPDSPIVSYGAYTLLDIPADENYRKYIQEMMDKLVPNCKIFCVGKCIPFFENEARFGN